MDTTTANRTETLGVRLTPAELREIEVAAEGLGMARATLARRIILRWLQAQTVARTEE